ncbi:MAG: ABC transporter ATP-binding protein [Verrucomicrobiales bacterium]
MSEYILITENLSKTFPGAGGELTILEAIDIKVKQGSTCAIVGPSGSGKTTLLGLCAGLDRPTSGEVTLAGRKLGGLTEDERAEIRNESVGFVFQNFQLIPTLTALENVLVPLELRGGRIRNPADRAREFLVDVGLGERVSHFPVQLSGGEQQRVALARAFICAPAILFADEPTGNLDGESSMMVEEMLFGLNKAKKTTLVIVTHDHELADKADMVLVMKDGRIVETIST